MGLLSRMLGKKYESITATAAQEAVSNGAVLVDVRSNGEWNAGHAPSATHLPVEKVRTQVSRLSKSERIIMICRSGARSAQAAAALAELGYQVSSVKGGMRAWKRAGGRVVARNGRDGAVI